MMIQELTESELDECLLDYFYGIIQMPEDYYLFKPPHKSEEIQSHSLTK